MYSVRFYFRFFPARLRSGFRARCNAPSTTGGARVVAEIMPRAVGVMSSSAASGRTPVRTVITDKTITPPITAAISLSESALGVILRAAEYSSTEIPEETSAAKRNAVCPG